MGIQMGRYLLPRAWSNCSQATKCTLNQRAFCSEDLVELLTRYQIRRLRTLVYNQTALSRFYPDAFD
jgi:hypothetical protein